MQCNLITYLTFLSARNVSAVNTRAQSIYNVTAINSPLRRKAGHRQHLLQPAWHLRDLLPAPFVRQGVALVGMSAGAEGSGKTSHVRISVWMAC